MSLLVFFFIGDEKQFISARIRAFATTAIPKDFLYIPRNESESVSSVQKICF